MVRLLAALAFAGTLFAQSPRRLIVISIDGLDARFLNDPGFRVKAPNLRRLMREGATANVVGVAPSETWPAHASLVTGVPPAQHGITANQVPGKPGERFFAASYFKTPTLWDATTHAGLKTATIYWPSTVGAQVAYNMPEYWETRTGNAVSLSGIATKSTPPSLVAAIQRMFPRFEKQLWDDASAAQAANYLLTTEHPAVLFIHFAELDAEQHDTGALSIYAREILENDDELIGQIVAGAGSDATIVVLSDHGFENSDYVVRPAVMLKRAGVQGDVEVLDGLIGTKNPAVAAHFRKLIGQTRRSGISREVPIAEVHAKAPELPGWVAAFDTLQNFIASPEDRGPALGPGQHLGVHGLWPTRPGYRSVFICRGPRIKAARLGEIDLLQIAPTLADIVAVKLPTAKAKSLWASIQR